MTSLRIGIDGGGTKTKCVIINDEMKIISQSAVGSTNINSLGKEKVVENLTKLIYECIKGVSSHELYSENEEFIIRSIGLGMSGCDRTEDRNRLAEWAKSILQNVPPTVPKNIKVDEELKIRVDNDAVNVISAGTLGVLEGIVLISGTGFICFGFANDGNFRTRGAGWGPKLLDRGSGYYIGQQVFVKITEMEDGLRKKTAMYDHVLSELGLENVKEIIPYVYHKCTEWSHVADLAKVCFDLYYKHADPTAEEIINDATECLFQYVKLVATKLHEQYYDKQEKGEKEKIKVTLVLSGSILSHEDSIVNAKLREMVQKELPHLIDTITFPKVDLEIGAALIAK